MTSRILLSREFILGEYFPVKIHYKDIELFLESAIDPIAQCFINYTL